MPSADADSPEAQWLELRGVPGNPPCAALDKFMELTGLRSVKRMALSIYLNIVSPRKACHQAHFFCVCVCFVGSRHACPAFCFPLTSVFFPFFFFSQPENLSPPHPIHPLTFAAPIRPCASTWPG